MLLAIDIGNTNVTIGLSAAEGWRHIWRLPTLTDTEALMYYKLKLTHLLLENGVDGHLIEKVVISTVVPELRAIFEELTIHFFNVHAVVVGPEVYRTLAIQVLRPNELGSDLYANALAAYTRYQRGVIIVDFGTALTCTVVDDKGAIIGVTIAPGLKTAIASLFSKTAQLPEVPLKMPDKVMGKSTVHAIQSGILNGYVGMVKHMIAAIRQEAGIPLLAVATGGLSYVLKPLAEVFHEIDEKLTLDGLKIVGQEYKI